MGDRTGTFAVQSLLATDTPDDQLGWELIAIMERVGHDYEHWCRIVDMDPDDEETEEMWNKVHWAFVDLWKEMGDKEFWKTLQPYIDKWASILGIYS